MWKRQFYLIVILVSLMTVTSSPILAQEDGYRAQELFNSGIKLFETGAYDEAAESFVAAYEVKPSWKLMFNIGQAYAAAKRYGLALDNFEQYLARGGDEIPQERMTQVIAEVDRLRKMVGVISVEAPDGTELYIDDMIRGALPLPGNLRVSMGEHRFVLQKDGEVLLEKKYVVTGSMRTEISVASDEATLPPESGSAANAADETVESDHSFDAATGETPSPSEQRRRKMFFIGAIVSGALGATGIGLATAFTVKGARDSNRLDDADSDYRASNNTDVDAYNRAKNADNDLKTDKTMMVIGFASGGVFAAGSVVLFVLSRKYKHREVSWKPTAGGVQFVF